MVLVLSISTMLTALFLISLYTYRVVFYSPTSNRPSLDIPLEGAQYEAVADHLDRMLHIMAKIPFEPVYVMSDDNLRLFGRYYHVKDNSPVEILFHGYRSHPFRDCSGGHALSRKMGFNALVVDQRAHGQSEGTTISFGISERKDCLSWVKYVNDRFGTNIPIILSGLSMGAATVLMASELEMPDNVVCVIADSPYTAPVDIIEKVCKDRHYPVRLCMPFIYLGAKLYGKFCLSDSSAEEAVSKSKLPILILHGEDDRFVPCQMSQRIASADPVRIRLQTFPKAGHGLSYIVDPIRYENDVTEFLEKFPKIRCHISPDFLNRKYE